MNGEDGVHPVLALCDIRHGGRPEGAADPAVIPADRARVPPYDASFFPSDRVKFLRAWLSTPGHVARMLVENGQIAGYSVFRPCREGAKIGRLFAEAEAAALALAEPHGMTPPFETARMYRGPAAELPLGRTFGIATFEPG